MAATPVTATPMATAEVAAKVTAEVTTEMATEVTAAEMPTEMPAEAPCRSGGGHERCGAEGRERRQCVERLAHRHVDLLCPLAA
jgi:hypothetical protein